MCRTTLGPTHVELRTERPGVCTQIVFSDNISSHLKIVVVVYGAKGVMELPTHLSIKFEINLFDLVNYIAY